MTLTWWTGGQYSLYRAIFGAYLFVHFAALIPYARELFSGAGLLPANASPLLHLFPNVFAVSDAPAVAIALVTIAAVASLFFLAGAFDRVAAIVIWYALACLFGRNPLIANPSLPFIGWLLLAHAFLPRAPYGSWTARGRVDPRGGWTMPRSIHIAAWMVMALGYSYSGYTKLVSPSWIDGTALARVLDNPLARPSMLRDAALATPAPLLQIATWAALAFELLFAPLALSRRLRPWIWLAMLSMHVALIALIDFADLSFAMIIVHLFTFDPRWVPRRAPASTDTIFYDGSCGLCHRVVRFVLAEDASGTAFRFAPLGGDEFATIAAERRDLPDSVVVRTAAGETLVRGDAALHIMQRIGGAWRALAIAAGFVPRTIRDALYDAVARARHKLFARPKDACPLMPPDLRSRFSA